MDTILVAILGLGRIASLLETDPLREKPCTHAGAVQSHEQTVLAAGTDRNPQRRTAFAETWRCPVYADAEAMLRSHTPQLLIIATHPDSHAYYCRMAAAYQVPVVICEKPLADSLAGARAIAALHRKGPTRILVNHERRYSADYIQAKAVLDSGRLGELLSIKASLYMGQTRRILDVLWHDGTHLVDAVLFLSGRMMRHEKHWGSPLTQGRGSAYLAGRLDPDGAGQGTPFLLEIGAGRDHLVFEVECSCARGRLRIGNGVFEVWESGPSPYAEGFRSLHKAPDAFTGPTGYFAHMLQDAVACVREPDRQPRSSALDGLRVIRYLTAVHPWGRAYRP
ncbi:MAG: Gfo/Idh/MocA family oxidoreductase [Spirochaetaceae bacterium]|jgi:predicted dehydrogenase|nr:Gfo/Idh/MocA family oxidoreductase [Spirochaetaceae bacterium]